MSFIESITKFFSSMPTAYYFSLMSIVFLSVASNVLLTIWLVRKNILRESRKMKTDIKKMINDEAQKSIANILNLDDKLRKISRNLENSRNQNQELVEIIKSMKENKNNIGKEVYLNEQTSFKLLPINNDDLRDNSIVFDNQEYKNKQSNLNELKELIKNFNLFNIEYFNNSRFFFLKLSSGINSANEGFSLSLDGKLKIDFQKIEGNSSQASYLGFIVDDKEIYLIPNLFNNRWKQVLSNDENKIFQLDGSSYSLVEPAMIESIGNDIWRLEKSGKFG